MTPLRVVNNLSYYWSTKEEQTLVEMVEQNKSLKEISGVLHRSPEAVRLKAKRMGLSVPAYHKVTFSSTTTTTPLETLTEIKPAELISMKEMMEIMVGALEQLRNQKSLSSLEVRRYRIIVSIARTYMRMLEKFERWTSVEQGLVDMQARFIKRFKRELQRTQDPSERQQIEQEIAELEESLAQTSKQYNYTPFKKKASAKPMGVAILAPSVAEPPKPEPKREREPRSLKDFMAGKGWR